MRIKSLLFQTTIEQVPDESYTYCVVQSGPQGVVIQYYMLGLVVKWQVHGTQTPQSKWTWH